MEAETGGLSYIAYKRRNHFQDWLEQFSDTTDPHIPDQIWAVIETEVRKQLDGGCPRSMTSRGYRDILKHHRLNKYYEHIPYIHYRLSGTLPVVINDRVKELLIKKFEEVSEVYSDTCPRRSFFSYSWLAKRLCELIEIENADDTGIVDNSKALNDHIAEFKSQQKNDDYMQRWCKITESLNWNTVDPGNRCSLPLDRI